MGEWRAPTPLATAAKLHGCAGPLAWFGVGFVAVGTGILVLLVLGGGGDPFGMAFSTSIGLTVPILGLVAAVAALGDDAYAGWLILAPLTAGVVGTLAGAAVVRAGLTAVGLATVLAALVLPAVAADLSRRAAADAERAVRDVREREVAACLQDVLPELGLGEPPEADDGVVAFGDRMHGCLSERSSVGSWSCSEAFCAWMRPGGSESATSTSGTTWCSSGSSAVRCRDAWQPRSSSRRDLRPASGGCRAAAAGAR